MGKGRIAAVVAVAVGGLVWGLPVSARAESGAELYDKKCKVCHSIKGEGGKNADKGGPLDGVGSKRDAKWLDGYIREPKSAIEDAKMPKMKLEDEEISALIEYMLSLK